MNPYEALLNAILALAKKAISWETSKAIQQADGDAEITQRILADRLPPIVRAFRRLAYQVAIAYVRSEGIQHGVNLDYTPGLALYPEKAVLDPIRRALRVTESIDPETGEPSKQISANRYDISRILGNILSRHVHNAARQTVRRCATDSEEQAELSRELDQETGSTGSARLAGGDSPLDRAAARMQETILAERREAAEQTGLPVDDPRLLKEFERLKERVADIDDLVDDERIKRERRSDYDKETKKRLHSGRPRGWARVLTGARSCWFCVMCASRGPVYQSAKSAGDNKGPWNSYHDHCDCKVVPVFDHRNWEGVEQYRQLEKMWRDVTWKKRDGKLRPQDGEIQRQLIQKFLKSDSGKQQLNKISNFRNDQDYVVSWEGKQRLHSILHDRGSEDFGVFVGSRSQLRIPSRKDLKHILRLHSYSSRINTEGRKGIRDTIFPPNFFGSEPPTIKEIERTAWQVLAHGKPYSSDVHSSARIRLQKSGIEIETLWTRMENGEWKYRSMYPVGGKGYYEWIDNSWKLQGGDWDGGSA